MEVQRSDDGQQLDCFGIYPHVLPLAYDWVLGETKLRHKYSDDTQPLTSAAIMYWGWTEHLYVMVHQTFSIHRSIYCCPQTTQLSRHAVHSTVEHECNSYSHSLPFPFYSVFSFAFPIIIHFSSVTYSFPFTIHFETFSFPFTIHCEFYYLLPFSLPFFLSFIPFLFTIHFEFYSHFLSFYHSFWVLLPFRFPLPFILRPFPFLLPFILSSITFPFTIYFEFYFLSLTIHFEFYSHFLHHSLCVLFPFSKLSICLRF